MKAKLTILFFLSIIISVFSPNVYANTAPDFLNSGTTDLVFFSDNISARDITSFLHVNDPDTDQTLTWTIESAPTKGTLSGLPATASSGSADITPGSTITYTPLPGQIGYENFSIKVSDGTESKSKFFFVRVWLSGSVPPVSTSLDGESWGAQYGPAPHTLTTGWKTGFIKNDGVTEHTNATPENGPPKCEVIANTNPGIFNLVKGNTNQALWMKGQDNGYPADFDQYAYFKSSTGEQFKLSSFRMENGVQATPLSYILSGYRDGVQVDTMEFSIAANAIALIQPTGASWENIDEFRICYKTIDSTFNNVNFAIDDINITAPVVTTDTVPPTILTANHNFVTATSATINAASSEAGTIYYVVTKSSVAPTKSQIILGEDNSGAPAAFRGSGACSAASAISFGVYGLIPGTQYYYYVVAKDTANNPSDIASRSLVTSVVAPVYGRFNFESSTGNVTLSSTITTQTNNSISGPDWPTAPLTVAITGSTSYSSFATNNDIYGYNPGAFEGNTSIYVQHFLTQLKVSLPANFRFNLDSLMLNLLTTGGDTLILTSDKGGVITVDIPDFGSDPAYNHPIAVNIANAADAAKFQGINWFTITSPANSNQGAVFTGGIDDIAISYVCIVPTISAVNHSTVTSDSANITATSNRTGTMYYVLTSSSSPPSQTQIMLGQDHTGAPAIFKGNAACMRNIAQTFNINSLAPGTGFYYYIVATDQSGGISSVSSVSSVSSGSFSTLIPTLTVVNHSAVTATNVTITATSNVAGTMYYVLTTSSTPPTDAQIIAGQNNDGAIAFKSGNSAITANSAKSFNVTELSRATNYYYYIIAMDGAGNKTGVSSGSFTTLSLVVTDGNISISGATGISGRYIIGDTVTTTWNNTAAGDNNSDITGVTVDFSQFGGGTAVPATNNNGIWTASYTIAAGSINGLSGRNVSVTATSGDGSTTTTDSTNATVDNYAINLPTGSGTINAVNSTDIVFTPPTSRISEDFYVYYVLTTNATPPSAADIKAGNGAIKFGNILFSRRSKYKCSFISGIPPATSFYLHYVMADSSGNLDTSVKSSTMLKTGLLQFGSPDGTTSEYTKTILKDSENCTYDIPGVDVFFGSLPAQNPSADMLPDSSSSLYVSFRYYNLTYSNGVRPIDASSNTQTLYIGTTTSGTPTHSFNFERFDVLYGIGSTTLEVTGFRRDGTKINQTFLLTNTTSSSSPTTFTLDPAKWAGPANQVVKVFITSPTTDTNRTYYLSNLILTNFNSAPYIVSNTGLEVQEDASATGIINTMLKASDSEQPASSLAFTIGTAPTKGILKNGSAILTSGSSFTQADIDNNLISYTPNADINGTDSFTFMVSDGTSDSISSTTFTLTITALNDAPVLSPGTPTLTPITEYDTEDANNNTGNTIAAILGNLIADADSGAAKGIAITAADSGNGKWQYSIDGSNWVDLGNTSENNALLLRATDKLRFCANGTDGTNASITFRAWDQTDGATAGTKVNITSTGSYAAFSIATNIASIAVKAYPDVYIDISFSEGIYGARDAKTPVDVEMFTVAFKANGGNATNVKIRSVKMNDNAAEGSASALKGGEQVIRVFLSIIGTPSGSETVEIKPASNAVIYDAIENPISPLQTTGEKTLRNKMVQ